MEQCGEGHSPGPALLMSSRAGRGFGGMGHSLFLAGTSSLFSTLLSSLTRAGTHLGMLPSKHGLRISPHPDTHIKNGDCGTHHLWDLHFIRKWNRVFVYKTIFWSNWPDKVWNEKACGIKKSSSLYKIKFYLNVSWYFNTSLETGNTHKY